MSDKRYQDSNKLVKLIRYRHYLYLPFKWLWYKYVRSFNIVDDNTLKEDKVIGVDLKLLVSCLFKKYILRRNIKIPKCVLWSLLIGISQGDMKWYYTQDEVMNFIKND